MGNENNLLMILGTVTCFFSRARHNDFEPVSGFTLQESIPLEEDSIEQQVRWEGHRDLASLEGKRIRLKFYLDGLAALYSFMIR